jgi:Ca2+-binding EF-hand superfamily protein
VRLVPAGGRLPMIAPGEEGGRSSPVPARPAAGTAEGITFDDRVGVLPREPSPSSDGGSHGLTSRTQRPVFDDNERAQARGRLVQALLDAVCEERALEPQSELEQLKAQHEEEETVAETAREQRSEDRGAAAQFLPLEACDGLVDNLYEYMRCRAAFDSSKPAGHSHDSYDIAARFTSVHVPDTILIRKGLVWRWYFTSLDSGMVLRKKRTSLHLEEVIKQLVAKGRRNRSGIVACYMTVRSEPGGGSRAGAAGAAAAAAEPSATAQGRGRRGWARRSKLSHTMREMLARMDEVKVRRLFKELDEDSSGCLDRDEIKALLAQLGRRMTRAELNRAMLEMDPSGDDQVNFDEFVQWWALRVNAADRAAPTLECEYFNAEELRSFFHRHSRTDGMLQAFVESSDGGRMSTIEVTWTPLMTRMTRRVNCNQICDTRFPRLQRLVTFDGADHHSEELPVPTQTAAAIKHACAAIKKHVREVAPYYLDVGRMVLYFRQGRGRVSLLWASSVRCTPSHVHVSHGPVALNVRMTVESRTSGPAEDVRRWREQRTLEAGLVVREEANHVETEAERKRAKQQAQERLWDLFHAMDTDASGSLDSDEVKLLTAQLGKRMTKVELAQALREMDPSGDGEVSFGEFVAWWNDKRGNAELLNLHECPEEPVHFVYGLPELDVVDAVFDPGGVGATLTTLPSPIAERRAGVASDAVLVHQQRSNTPVPMTGRSVHKPGENHSANRLTRDSTLASGELYQHASMIVHTKPDLAVTKTNKQRVVERRVAAKVLWETADMQAKLKERNIERAKIKERLANPEMQHLQRHRGCSTVPVDKDLNVWELGAVASSELSHELAKRVSGTAAQTADYQVTNAVLNEHMNKAQKHGAADRMLHVRGIGGTLEDESALAEMFGQVGIGKCVQATVRHRIDATGKNTSWALLRMEDKHTTDVAIKKTYISPETGEPLVVNRFDPKQAAKSDGNMAKVRVRAKLKSSDPDEGEIHTRQMATVGAMLTCSAAHYESKSVRGDVSAALLHWY